MIHKSHRSAVHGLRTVSTIGQRFHRDESGQIIFVALFGAIALFILVALLLNNADKLNEKIRMQNAADVAALSSAEVMASGLNSISDNNVAVTETIALRSVLQGMVDAAHDPKLIGNYYGVYFAAKVLKNIPIIRPVAEVVYQIYRVAWSYSHTICEYTDSIEDAVSLLETQGTALDNWNTLIATGYVFIAHDAANNAARLNGANHARVGNATVPFLRFPIRSVGAGLRGVDVKLPVPQRGDTAEWRSPTEVGSESSTWTYKSNRRGYFHVYRAHDDEELYPLNEGPYLSYLRKMKNLPWFVPYVDPTSIIGHLKDLISLGGLVDSIFGSGSDEDPDEQGLGIIQDSQISLTIDKLVNSNGNDTFEDKSERRLTQFIEDMDQGPIALEPYIEARQSAGIVAVAYGNRRSALIVAGDRRDLGVFTRRINGFVQPIAKENSCGDIFGTQAVAQAQVYNPVSWDLFTQYWDYKLTRTTRIPAQFLSDTSLPCSGGPNQIWNGLIVLDATEISSELGAAHVQQQVRALANSAGLEPGLQSELYH